MIRKEMVRSIMLMLGGSMFLAMSMYENIYKDNFNALFFFTGIGAGVIFIALGYVNYVKARGVEIEK